MKYKDIALYVATLLIGFIFLYFAFRKQSFFDLLNEIKQVNYWWSVPVLIITLLNHFLRAYRWKILIKTYHQPPLRLFDVFTAMISGYFANIAIPRLGEITRCGTLEKSANTAFAPTFGTVVTERIIDILSLLVIVVFVFIWQIHLLLDFVQEFILSPILQILPAFSANYLIIGLAFLTILVVLFYYFRKLIPNRIQTIFQGLLQGLTSILKLPKKELLQFFLLTIGLWATYLLMSYCWFRSLAATQHLGIDAAFSLLAIGSLARSIPIQGGGMGAYHFIASKLLIIYSVSELQGLALVTVIHAFQTLFYLTFGGLCLLINIFQKRNLKLEKIIFII